MSKIITVQVITMGGDVHQIETPIDITGDELIQELLSVLHLPIRDAEGHQIHWRLDNKNTGKTLNSDRSLDDEGVAEGHQLILIRLTINIGISPDSPKIFLSLGRVRKMVDGNPLIKLITVLVATMGGEVYQVEISIDTIGAEFIREFVSAARLPLHDAEGHPIKWRLDNASTGRTLTNDRSLDGQGVADGHQLMLIRAITAGCFPESAKVFLSSGRTIEIREIRTGEDILAFDSEARSYYPTQAQGIYQQTYLEQIEINEKLITTADQHILLANYNWRLAGDLAAGDTILTYPFCETKVLDVRKKNGLTPMFSLTLPPHLCFVVEGFIVKDLIGKQAYLPRVVDVFLSYSSADKDQARKIFDILEKNKITTFLAERSIKPGEIWEGRIKENLKNCRNFWILVTPNSLHSEWVITEWAAAWALGKTIVPILFRCRPEELPKRLQAYHCVDFHMIEDAIMTIQSNH